MVEGIIKMAAMALPPAQLDEIKKSFSSIIGYIPMIEIYHKMIPKEAGETGIAYMLMVEPKELKFNQIIISEIPAEKIIFINRMLSVDGLLNLAKSKLTESELKLISGGIKKVDEFLPLIDSYHNTIKKEAGEVKIAYMLVLKVDKVMLYQIVLKADEKLQKTVISRTLGSWNIMEQARQILDIV